jgi:glutathione reductase (NADPH)
MQKAFDLVAIGTGTAASVVATKCRNAGWRVAVIDSRPFGGTCALRGCDPKKVLVGATEAIDSARRLQGKGVRSPEAGIDWAELMRFKRTFTEPVAENREKNFKQAGIETFHGRARFVGPTAVQVEKDVLEGRYVLIGAGAKPVDLEIPGTEHLTTSDRFLELEELPSRILFVGGGYISFEFSHIAARAGAQVTLLHRSARPLGGFDPDLVDLLVERTRKLGIDVHLETEVGAVERTGRGLTVQASTGNEMRTFEADLVVHGAGRVADIDDMALEKAGIEWEGRGVRVNEYLQSVSNASVYAAGDAAASAGPPLTPVAAHEGRIVGSNLLEGNHRKVKYPPIPSVVFTVPPLARVGLGEQEAAAQGIRFKSNYRETSGWYTSRRVSEQYSGYKVLVEEETDRILGAHVLGPHAEEVINLFAMAIVSGMKPKDIKKTIFAYPTAASDMRYMV